jgi:hypothetical protein
MLPPQRVANLLAKFGVGLDLIAHGFNTLNGALSSGGRFGTDSCASLRECGLMPVLCMDLDDVRGACQPGRKEAQAPRADFEFANSRRFLAQVVAQGATIVARFTFEAFAYAASKKDSEIHNVEFWFQTELMRYFDSVVCSSCLSQLSCQL